MKYFIWVVVVLASITAGGAGVGYKLTSQFEDMTGVKVGQFVEGYDQCVKVSGEPCNLYGGFAPLSKFSK